MDAAANPRVFRPELDLLRFVAFVMVFMHHQLPRESGDFRPETSELVQTVTTLLGNVFSLGLCLFFFLSAYLITDLLLREKERTQTVHLRMFYMRRILRIWPLYFLGCGLGVLYAALVHKYDEMWIFGWYVLLLGNWYFAAHAWTYNPSAPLWSISIEEQFYLFWPALVKFCSTSALAVLALVLIAVAVGTQLKLGDGAAELDTTVWTNSFVQFELFGFGAMAAIMNFTAHENPPRLSRPFYVLLAVIAWFFAIGFFRAKLVGFAQSGTMLATGYFLVAAGCYFAFKAIDGWRRKIPAPLLYLGRISFGLYVFHLFAGKLVMIGLILVAPALRDTPVAGASVSAVLSLLLTIALASLSYAYLETPFLKMKTHFTLVRSRPI